MIFFLAAIISFSFACNDNNVKPDTEVIRHTFKLESSTFPSLHLCFIEKEDEPNKAYFRGDDLNPQSYCYISPRHIEKDSATFLKEKELFFYLSRTGFLIVLNLQKDTPKICRLATIYVEGYRRELFFCGSTLFLAAHVLKDKKYNLAQDYQVFVHKISLGESGCSSVYVDKLEGEMLFKKNVRSYIAQQSFVKEDETLYDSLAVTKQYEWNERFLEYKRKQG
jgi:hypothetical protein